MSLTSNEFLKNLKSEEKGNLRLAKVTQIEETELYITFFGEDVQSGKPYKLLSSYKPSVGDTVCVAEINGSWVVLGKVSDCYEDPEKKSSNQLVNNGGVVQGIVQLLYYSDNKNYFTLSPNLNSRMDIGYSSYKWRNIYATNGTIQTSDKREKENVNHLEDKHIDLFLKLIPKTYTMVNGTSGRTHIGFVAQDVEKAMNECGISDLDFAGLIRSPVHKVVDGVETEEIEDYMYGLRYEEFIGILTYVLQDVIAFLKELGYRK